MAWCRFNRSDRYDLAAALSFRRAAGEPAGLCRLQREHHSIVAVMGVRAPRGILDGDHHYASASYRCGGS